jgi:hypothetical protein
LGPKFICLPCVDPVWGVDRSLKVRVLVLNPAILYRKFYRDCGSDDGLNAAISCL